jgi:hypothetical protein
MKSSVCQLIVWLMAAPFLLQCNSPEKSTLCFLTAYTRTDGVQSVSVTYVYQNSLLTSESRTESGITSETSYEYDAKNNLIKSVTNSPNFATRTATYSYNNQNTLVATLIATSDWTETLQYTYNENRQLIRESSTYTSAAGDIVEVRIFTYPDILTTNPSEVALETAGVSTYREMFEYDDRINPFRNLPTSIQAANNVVKLTRVYSLSLLEVTSTTSYQYNSEGYPVSATSSSGVTETWSYACQEI